MINHNKQTGAVMLWSLVILLVLLVMGVASIRLSGLDTRIAGNTMFNMLTSQAAESSISRTSKLFYLDMASKSVGHHAVNAGMTDATSFGAGVININSDADITLPVISMDCPVLIGLANSLDAARGAGGMDCQLYEIEANSSLQGASAKSRHSTGIIKFIPSTSKRPST